MDEQHYDITVIGGGLAGLALSIQLAKQGRSVALFEKEKYPFHKVCGEYISMESWDFIEGLGLPLSKMDLPKISKLQVSAPGGKLLKQDLPLGGFGISRYYLDHALKSIALANGVTVYEHCKVNEVSFSNDQFHLQTTNGDFCSKVCCGSYGKRSNLDLKWKRDFILQKANKLNNYIGVKYHIETDFPADTIVLHNFEDGYCGMSKIEDGKFCLCYLTNAKNLKANGNSIALMEAQVLHKNPFLKEIFTKSKFLYESPVTISQVSFDKKSQVEDHVLLLGDAAGMITPLCGNGMSMALHGSKIAAQKIELFLRNELSRVEMELQYIVDWKRTFSKRLQTGRLIQRFFGKTWITNAFVRLMKMVPAITKQVIKQTHGSSF